MKYFVTGGLFSVILAVVPAAQADILYSTLPGPSVHDEPSMGYQATKTSEFGSMVQLLPSAAPLGTATVALSNWAFESAFEDIGTSSGFNLPVTLNLYSIGSGDTVGPLIGSVSTTQLINWRPEPSGGCDSNGYLADGNCYGGSISYVTFEFGGISIPQQFIWGLAFNTQSFGSSPYGVPGAYDALNIAISSDAPSTGSNPLPDTAYWNTADAGNYTDGGAGGVGTFRQDTGWAPFGSCAIQFENTAPEPSSLLLISLGLIGAGALGRKARKQR